MKEIESRWPHPLSEAPAPCAPVPLRTAGNSAQRVQGQILTMGPLDATLIPLISTMAAADGTLLKWQRNADDAQIQDWSGGSLLTGAARTASSLFVDELLRVTPDFPSISQTFRWRSLRHPTPLFE